MPSIFGKSGSTAGGAGRAKPRHKSIRGTISAPIPIPKTPDDDEFPIRNPGSAKASVADDDDDFPIREPGTGIATPLPLTHSPGPSPDEPVEQQPGDSGGKEQQGQQGQQTGGYESSSSSGTERQQEQGGTQFPAPAGAPASVSGSGGSRTDLTRDVRPKPSSTPPITPQAGATMPGEQSISRPASRSPPNRTSPQKRSPPNASPLRASPQTRRATNPVVTPFRYSAVSDAPSNPTGQSKDSPQRKKSTLRSALGRLFGRGRKKTGSGNQDAGTDSGRESGPLASTQHRSDPTAQLSRPTQRSPERSASLPISELNRPLRSHSIGPDDIMAIESARNSLQAEAATPGSSSGVGIRRRAATGGHALLRPHLFNREWGAGLSPRPASAQGRACRAGARAEAEDPSEIGRAITSDSAGGMRRRSRSLSGLQDLVGVQPGSRRRSDEIRYWRESYDPGFMSPLSSNAQDDVDDTGPGDISAPDSPAAERPPKTPPQPFNFNLLSKEMMGMKITHAASMDMRLGNLESRTLQLERVVDQLCRSVPGSKGPVDARETGQPGSSRRSLETDTHSHVSFGEGLAYASPLHPLSSSAAKAPSLAANAMPPVHATSTSAVRGAMSMPIMGREAASKTDEASQADVIAQLRADLDAERVARQALEASVKKLSERLNTLSTTMFAMVRGPSESKSQERLAPSSVGGSSPMLKPPTTSLLVPPPPQEQLSVFETDDDEEEGEEEDDETEAPSSTKQSLSSAKADSGEDEVTEDDDFETPREERTPLTYGAFGEELRPDDDDDDDDDDDAGGDGSEDDPKRKKAARTLSLSQLTLGKGQRTRI
ncbi:uncharacterized protein B0T15DRAFT_43193 [Chaetomium strumarium]|uniref:Uncharacterized protein n=1 Tax=Chaetomium strumarium TaxID=1170767 RepID=A0AAJ0H2F0_9PEZI|nr:hypothetical protein B0T15DRAFT_43193 [Chaetomium strumarium]